MPSDCVGLPESHAVYIMRTALSLFAGRTQRGIGELRADILGGALKAIDLRMF